MGVKSLSETLEEQKGACLGAWTPFQSQLNTGAQDR